MFVNVSYSGKNGAISRGNGQSAVNAAAYRSGQALYDERTGQTHDYSRRKGVNGAEMLTPDNAPDWASDRAACWNAVEADMKRKDARLAKSLVLHPPRGRQVEEQREVARQWAKENFTDKGFVVDIAFHDEGGRNPHAHVMVSYRKCGPDGFYGPMWSGTTEKIPDAERTPGGPQTREKLDSHDTERALAQWQESYRRLWNDKMEASGSDHRFRSCKERGYEHQPKIGLSLHRDQRQRQHYLNRPVTPKAIQQDITEKYFEVMWGREWAWEGYDPSKDHDRGMSR